MTDEELYSAWYFARHHPDDEICEFEIRAQLEKYEAEMISRHGSLPGFAEAIKQGRAPKSS